MDRREQIERLIARLDRLTELQEAGQPHDEEHEQCVAESATLVPLSIPQPMPLTVVKPYLWWKER